MIGRAAAPAAEGGDHRGQRLELPLSRHVGLDTAELNQGVDRRRLGNHNVVGQRRQHLRNQGRSAARHVKNEAAGHDAWRTGVLRQEIVHGHAIAEHAVERSRQRAPDRILEERRAQIGRAETGPIDESAAVRRRDVNGKPAARRPGRAVRGRGAPPRKPERVNPAFIAGYDLVR